MQIVNILKEASVLISSLLAVHLSTSETVHRIPSFYTVEVNIASLHLLVIKY